MGLTKAEYSDLTGAYAGMQRLLAASDSELEEAVKALCEVQDKDATA